MRTCHKTFLLLLLLCGPVFAAQPGKFTFTKILEFSGRSGTLVGGSLNEQGTAVVTLSLFGVGDTILAGDGRTLSVVAQTASIGSFGPATITNQGDVIFGAVSREGRRILLSRKGQLSTLLTGVVSQFVPVNGRGTVAFLTFLPERGVYAVATLDHGEVTVITTFVRPILVFDVNQRGQVLAMTDPGRPASSTLLVGDGRTIRIVADAHDDLHSGFFFEAVMNERGTVAFSAFLGGEDRRIYLADPQGGLTPVVTSDGPFAFFTLAGLTNSGTPVFTASLDTGGSGVFTGPDPVADKVIATGDILDGARVTYASVVDVNASGQLLLWVSFENGSSVLYRTQHGGVH
jgi:hypothetical protein